MLVLTRKTNQSIVIGDDVEISVLAVAGDKVRIGIEAPRSVPVYRKEVWLEIQREGPRSTATEPERRHVDEELQKLKSGD
jgi:carbon storage regulator